jgi:superkiller protein 3
MHWTRRFSWVLTAVMLGAATLPAVALEPSTGPLVAQAPGVSTAIPAEVQGWFDGAKAAAARGEAAEALRLQKQVVAWLEANPGASVVFRARALNNLGVWYSELGRRQEALAPTEEAVKIRRELAKSNGAYLGDLARALNNLGVMQLAQGEPEQARASYEESLEIIRPLAAANRAFAEDLQRTLNNLEELKRQEGTLMGDRVLGAADLTYLPRTDPTASVKRAVVRLVPTFGGPKPGAGLYGTGFVVKRQGDRAWIATALHVVRNLSDDYGLATKVEAELFTGPLPAGVLPPRLEVVLPSPESLPPAGDDLVVLEVRGLPADVQPLPLTKVPPAGMVMVVGHPTDRPAWTVERFAILKSKDRHLWLEGRLDKGASGSPVLNGDGQVVGVAYEFGNDGSGLLSYVSAWRSSAFPSLLP